ncbi:hypothetical protein PVAND_003655 [Polypedilum vanderplanki]|uniref:Sorting nexin-13 n=1 Tax=Polypedilum vanderplanki TaxID=319348 RepID=A0A9J6BV86_POLVA|nr:hypothetical protein PVAND_003655 [Polypedilum vanderplanki]
MLAFISVILSNSTGKTVKKLIYSDPLSENYSKTTLGLKLSERQLSPSKKLRTISGNSDIDDVIHRILDLIFRDFIDSWYTVISDNREFTKETRLLIEDSLSNFNKRLKHAPLMQIITTTMLDDISEHSRAFHDAKRMVAESQKGTKSFNKLNSSFHRRNKSESDVTWNIGNANIQKRVANSTFYSVQTDEKLFDPEKQLIETFFDITGNTFKKEVYDDKILETHFSSVMETCMYFVMNSESFNCDQLRTLVTSILAGFLTKLISKIISDPDFINFQIAHIFANNPPPSEWLIKIIRQSNDLSELRAIRHLITQEMDIKHRDKNCIGELASLSFTQKVIDIRITSIQNSKDKNLNEKEKTSVKLPLLTLDEILSKDLALSYYLDYLQIMNLQKYVIFYCLAQDWRILAIERMNEIYTNDNQRLKNLKDLRDRAFELYKEYLLPSSVNHLNIDHGLIEVLHIKIRDTFIQPDPSWFESISKFVYEKLKNEHVFLQNFYESPAYKKLINELVDNENDTSEIKTSIISTQESGSDSNSGDYLLDELDLLEEDDVTDGSLNVISTVRHQRSHSDTGVLLNRKSDDINEFNERKLSAKIINTAINSDGKFAVYAIHVIVIETDISGIKQQKSWHIYRRYSKFLELKKLLVKQFPFFRNVSLPFPKKQTFHNTNRDLLERRMVILNEFLQIICNRAETESLVMSIVREFLEPDNDDRQIHGTTVVKQLVFNPIKTGMKTIKSVPDNVIGGLSKIFTTKNVDKFSVNDMMDAATDNPALASFANFLDAAFDLDARSQWLKRGIHRIILAPFVSQSISRKIKEIVQKNILDPEVVHGVLCAILNNVWPNGVFQDSLPREDTTRLRTRLAAKVALFAYFTDDLKHILGSETSRLGLTNFYEMLQYQTLNKRLILILLNRLLTTVFPTDNLSKHVVKSS